MRAHTRTTIFSKWRACALGMVVTLMLAGGTPAFGQATLSSDKPDYCPGEIAILTGTDFGPMELIWIDIDILDPNTGEVLWPDYDWWGGPTDECGWFQVGYLIPCEAAGKLLRARATGETTGLWAETTFTDSASANLDQARNGTPASPTSPVDFQNGNAGEQNSHYAEGMSVPYRVLMKGLPTDGAEITLVLGYDIKRGGYHAIDYLTHYDRLQPHYFDPPHDQEVVDPTYGVPSSYQATPAYSGGPDSTIAIAAPSSVNSPVPGQPTDSFNDLPEAERVFSLWNGTLLACSYVSEGDLTADQAETRIQVVFTASSERAMLAWGGHIASRYDWGFDDQGNPLSAAGISGSPYHMRLIDWTLGNLGNQDLSLSALAIVAPPTCEITCPPEQSFTCVCESTGVEVSWDDPTGEYTTLLGCFTESVPGSGDFDTLITSPTTFYTTTTIQCRALGGYDLLCTCEWTVSVEADTTPPTVTCPPDLTTDCASSTDPPDTGEATCSDDCGDCTVSYSDSVLPGGTPGSYVITRTWVATDECSNQSTCDQTITVTDTTPPTITCPDPITGIECASDVPAPAGDSDEFVDLGGSVSDNCGPVAVMHVGDQSDGQTCPETITRTYRATDAAGNTTDCTQVITVDDLTPPVVTGCPDNIIVPPTSGDCTEGWADWTDDLDGLEAIDNCDGELTPVADHSPGWFPVGTTTVRYTATDTCGNEGYCEFTVTVLDAAVFDMSVELVGGPFVLNTPFNRCIEFKFYDCTQPPATQLVATYRQQTTFVSTDGVTAVATMVIGSLPCGNFTCVTARDPLHTLRSTVELGTGLSILPTGHWQADFVSGDALISGNSDGIGGPYGGQIDIVDFTQLAYQWNQTVGADTTCETPAPHTDFSGDGYVDLADWSFLLYNFGQVSQPVCCQSRGEADEPEIREEISVRELESLGLGYLRVVDVDGDGWITMTDVQKYIELQQSQPEPQDTGQIRPPGVQQLSGDR
jgi:hypothetical protein